MSISTLCKKEDLELGKHITSSTKGVALIVTNPYSGSSQLKGTYQDGMKFMKFLSQCNYTVFWCHGVTKSDFTSYCKQQLAKFRYPKTCRRLVVVFSGHGDEGDTLECQDGETVSVSEMLKWFKPADAENVTLGNMVRMFFIDACRGRKKDYGYPTKCARAHTNDKITSHIKYPNDVDMLVAHSTTSEYVSTDTKGGGIWINNLLKELNKNPYRDIESILKGVNKIMKSDTIHGGGYYQIGEYKSTLSEDVCFKEQVRLVQSKEELCQSKEGLCQLKAGLSQSKARPCQSATGFEEEAAKGGCKQGGAQIVGSLANGSAKEIAKKVMNGAVVQATTATAKETAKQAAKQTAKVAVPIGIAIEVACCAYEINRAHDKKRRGEITETEYHDICVEQTATSGGSAAGGIAGSAGGAAIGATVGSVVPGLGTAIGGIVGGIVGGIYGGLGGSLVGKTIGKGINYARH